MENENIPLLDCPMDFLVGDASGNIMNEYGRFPCKIKCGVYAFLVRGSARATLNISEIEFRQNDFITMNPGTFLLIHEFSEDALVYYLLLSSSFLEKYSYVIRSGVEMTPPTLNPHMHLTDEVAGIISRTFQLLFDALNCTPPLLTTEKMVPLINVFQLFCSDYIKDTTPASVKPMDRKTEVYQEYWQLVLKHYQKWHHVAQYAEAMRISLPHLCATVKQVSGKTAGEIINEAILTDAKSQLKITHLPIKEIAASLGFDEVAFFNRFFKARVGMTPKEYRKS